jgi:uncharacterized protein (DUF433 family)
MSAQLNDQDYGLTCDPKVPLWGIPRQPSLLSVYMDDWEANATALQLPEWWWNDAKTNHVTRVLQDLTDRVMFARPQRIAQARSYTVPLIDSFYAAAREYSAIDIDPEVMAGAPCIAGTRIPVYMVLDAIEYYGEVEGALRSYPHLSIRQIKDAIGFAKLVVECPIDDNLTSIAR